METFIPFTTSSAHFATVHTQPIYLERRKSNCRGLGWLCQHDAMVALLHWPRTLPHFPPQKWLEVSSKKSSDPPGCELCQYQYIRHKKFVVS